MNAANPPESTLGALNSARASEDNAELARLINQLVDRNLRFPARPAFVQDFDVFDMPDGLGVQFRGGEAPVLLRGRSLSAVFEFLRARLDGSTTVDALIRSRPPALSAATLVRALLVFHSKGLLNDGLATLPAAVAPYPQLTSASDDPVLSRQLLFWGRHLSITRGASSGTEVQRRIETAQVVILGTGLFGAAMVDLLARSGFRNLHVTAWNDDGAMQALVDAVPLSSGGFRRLETTSIDSALDVLQSWADTTDLLVTATCDAPSALFRSINDLCLQRNYPWLHANADGSVFELGPLIQPYESACYTCLELRRRSAQDLVFENEVYQEHLATERPAEQRVVRGEAVWASTLAASIIVGDVVRLVTGLAPLTLSDSELRLAPVTGVIEQNQITRVPRCPDCYRGEIPAEPIEDLARTRIGVHAIP